MKILPIMSLFIVSGLFADNNATLNIVTDSNTTLPMGIGQAMSDKDTNKDNNKTLSNNATKALPSTANIQNNKTINPYEQLKDDIITFTRPEYISKDAIKDPFIYIYPQSEAELAFITKMEQSVLTLKGIFNDGSVYKANINNRWLEEGGKVEGWEVLKIDKDEVELGFRDKKRILKTVSSKVKIIKEDQ